jgi:dihydroxyacetone kinase-like protein
LLDACAIGDVFAGPSVGACMAAIRAADGGKGVLRLYGNYGGDRMNFDLAGETLADDGIETTTVLGTDDIASAPPGESNRRRGVAGIVFAYKIAGAAAAAGADLGEVTRLAARAVERCRTIGVALSPCQIPGADAPSFVLADDEIEMGMGIHGEPGIWRDKLRPADAVAGEMADRLLAEVSAGTKRVSILVNSLGATPLEELFILYRAILPRVQRVGLEVTRPLVGHYATSMEMAGVSISIFALDSELEPLLAAPANCPFWRV